ncbi:MAG TPA: TonB-dependent receptor [Terriglobales bacterium]|jgi:outer membrane receptor protein involved in Fe transport|nr:TonB-dependent receptor [Terriglobales bacterium]
MSLFVPSRRHTSFGLPAVVGLLVLLCFLLMPQGLSAQVSTTGKIAGTVTDSSGAAVPNLAVSVKSSALLVPRTTRTEGDGSYLFDLLPPGTYELTVAATGFNTAKRTDIVLTAGFTATINLSLKVGDVSQVVKVEGEPVIDLQNNETSTTFDQTLLQDIPSGRDPWSTVAQVPGATVGTFDVAGDNSYQQSTMQVHGSTPAEQIYSFNGLDLNWPGANGGYTQFYTNHDSFDEFQVVADNAPASVPIGGVYMNMVTKSGSNELHGQVGIYYLTSKLQAGVKAPIYNGSPVISGSPFDMTRDTTASLGGPLVKDRWWLFGSYRRYDLRQRILAVTNQDGSPVVDVNHQTNTDLRSDFQVNSKNKFSFVWLYNEQNRFFRRDTAYQFVTTAASWKQIEPAYVLEGLWTSQVTSNLILDFRVGWNKITFPLSYQPGVSSTDINVQDVGTRTESVAAPYEFANPAWVLKWSAGASWYKGNFHGTHNFKFGFEMGKAYNSYLYHVNGGINELFHNGNPFQIIAYDTPAKQKNYFRDGSFYVQDTWTVARRLTLELGIRYDHFNTYYPQQTTDAAATFPQLFPATTYPASGNLVDWNTVSPRLGLAFDLTGKGDSVLRASYGRYYLMQGTGLAETANPVGFAGKTFTWIDADGDKIPQQSEWLVASQQVGAFGGSSTHINTNMSRPYSEQISVGYEKQLWRNLRVGVTYYYRTKKNMIGIENTLVSPSDYTPITVLPDANGAPQPITNGLTGQPLTLFNLNPAKQTAFNFVVTNIPKLDDNAYHGVEFTAVKRLSNKWQLLSGFTIQRQKGVFGRGFSDQATSDNFTDPNNDINRNNNYLNSDATYIFKVDSSYELPFKIGTSVNFQHYTGLPIQPQEIFGTNGGLTQGSETVILQPAGITRLPSVNMLNFRISREFVVKDRWHVIPVVDFFNLTNGQTPVSENNFVDINPANSTYLRPSLTIDPFVTRFGLRFTF